MELHELATFLDAYLDLASFDDASVNGLQLHAGDGVAQLAVAVDASLDAIEGAAEQGAQLLLVHHGLLWGGATPLTGVLGRRVKRLFEQGVSLYAAHLPLDAHTEVGNNACLARVLDLEGTAPFGRYRGRLLGLAGRLAVATDLDSVIGRLTDAVGPSLGEVRAGDRPVQRVAVVSGAAGDLIGEAAAAGVDLVVTGEPDHVAAVSARDAGIHLAFFGHHATERFGVRALADVVQRRFQLPWTEVGSSSGF
jgi:dinuclear metal center YbgI/SA1388 family protein